MDMILDAGLWILVSGYWMLDTGYGILDTGYWILDFKRKLLLFYRASRIQNQLVKRHKWILLYIPSLVPVCPG